MKLRYGTRGSALALAQAKWAASRLEASRPGLETEPVVIQTSGDRFSAVPSPGVEEVNVKALFVKEIEEALSAGTIDFAVHSAKDLPGELPAELMLAAFPEREDPRDAYIGGSAVKWIDLKAGDTVATGSLRRRIQIKAAVPLVEFVGMRGNVDTRLRKLSQGEASGLVLARAGLIRLGLKTLTPHETLPVDLVVPAPGQGALALEARRDRKDVLEILSAVDHSETRLAVDCERSFLRAMGGGCRTPLGAYADTRGGRIRFYWFWARMDGTDPKRGSFDVPGQAQFERQSAELARELIPADGR